MKKYTFIVYFIKGNGSCGSNKSSYMAENFDSAFGQVKEEYKGTELNDEVEEPFKLYSIDK